MLLGSVLALTACGEKQHETVPAGLAYPATTKVDHVDHYHGVDVADPFRWLEDDVRENPAVSDWVVAQNEVTFAYLGDIPEKPAIEKRLKELWDYEKYGVPEKKGGRYFYEYNDGLKNQDQIYLQASIDAEPELLVDPNAWSEDGTVALASYFPSPDGMHLAYLVQDGGSDWRIARVMEIDSGKVLDEQLEWLKF